MAEKAEPGTLECFRVSVREASEDAVTALKQSLMSEDTECKIKAAKIILEFAWGKPAMSIQHTFPGEGLKHKVFTFRLRDSPELIAADEMEGPEGDAAREAALSAIVGGDVGSGKGAA